MPLPLAILLYLRELLLAELSLHRLQRHFGYRGGGHDEKSRPPRLAQTPQNAWFCPDRPTRSTIEKVHLAAHSVTASLRG